MIAQAFGIAFALGAAFSWGGADFAGGIASRRISSIAVLLLSRIALLAVLTTLAVVLRDPFPSPTSIAWAAAAGASGSLGIAALYRGLAIDHSALVVPTGGVVGAGIPVMFAATFEGVLPAAQQLGLVVGLLGIFLVSRSGSSGAGVSPGLKMGLLAGIGFGGFFLCLAQVEAGAVFTPLAIAGCAGLTVSLLVAVAARIPLPSPTKHPLALLAGVLDATGAVCYLLATGWIRIDVAAVLSSLYPAIAVLLFRLVLNEPVRVWQWVGLALCVLAIALIAL